MNNTIESTDNKSALLAYIQSLGIEYKADFVPLSKSRNAKEKNPSLNWAITLSRGNRSLTTDYMQGIGHLPGYNYKLSRLVVYTLAVNKACETGKSSLAAQTDKHPPRLLTVPAPDMLDVLYSLISDSEAINYSSFEEWANDYGYDVDSRKAEKVYRGCMDIAVRLRALIGDSAMEKLRELFCDY